MTGFPALCAAMSPKIIECPHTVQLEPFLGLILHRMVFTDCAHKSARLALTGTHQVLP
jgi:hypothetical protein